ncbi:MAG: hypothetical protein WCE45_06845, partial [Sedimentisphaerales bacterium]
DYGEPLERWIEIMISDSGSLERWIAPGWTPTPQVFSKVSNYFDADVYTGNYLGDGVPTPGTWGLSERTNYQFLSWTTIFNNDPVSSLYYFPNPAKIHTVEVNESGRVYLSGYDVNHLARQTMSYDHLRHNHLDKAWCVLGEAIYDDYAEVSLPRTINYATGLANYFFRGRLSVQLNYLTCEEIRLNITNESQNSGINQSLKGGVFELYWDEPNGNRTEVAEFIAFDSNNPADSDVWSSSCVLAYGQSIRAEFPKPAGAVEKFILVYKGNICENSAEPDTDDSNALAVAIITNPGCSFASNDCCCFLEPNTPGSCGNPNWNAYPPFGGPGKTPKYITVTFSDIGGWGGINGWAKGGPNRKFVLSYNGGCSWSCSTIPASDGSWWYCGINNGGISLESHHVASWRIGWTYAAGVTVTMGDDQGYDCKLSHISNNNNKPGEGANWEACWDGPYDLHGGHCDDYACYCIAFAAQVGSWNEWYEPWHAYWGWNFGYYNAGNVVRVDETDYICIMDHCGYSNTKPGEGSGWQTYWAVCDSISWGEHECQIYFEMPNSTENDGDGWNASNGNGRAYISLVSHVPSCDSWKSSYEYNAGDSVNGSDGENYVCNVPHTSHSNNKPVTGVNWEDYWTVGGGCGCGPNPTKRTLNISAGEGGTVTEPGGPGNYDYSESETVAIKAVPNDGYVFENWTGRATGGAIANPDVAETTIWMNASYAIKANFVLEPPEDPDPPTPNPSTWSVPPHAEGGKHKMTATTATDESPPVYYQFEHVNPGGGGSSSGWQENSYYECSASSPDAYQVRTKDSLGNIGSYSVIWDTETGQQ